MKKTNKVNAIRLLIIDDHQIVRDGIKVMLDAHSELYNFVITEAISGEDGLRKILQNEYDIVLVDYQMPKMNGAETVEKIMLYKPETKILALSNYDEVNYILNMLNAGAKGYVLKNIEPSQLINAITTIIDNKPYYSNEVALRIIDHQKGSNIILEKSPLSKKELAVLKLIAMEMSNEEISKHLNVAKRTIDSHRQNILNKLHIKNTAGLVKAAIRLKLIDKNSL